MNKRSRLTAALVMLLLLYLPCSSENLFYHAGKETYSLTPIPTKRATLTPPSLKQDSDYVERIGARIQMENNTVTQIPEGKQNIIFEKEGKLSLPVFSINGMVEVILLPEIVLKSKMPTYDFSSFVDKYHLELAQCTDLYQIYSVPIESDVIDIANKLYESNEFDFAYPNLFCSAELHSYIPNDPYFQYQIACHNVGQTIHNGHSGTIDADINAPEAWEITKGSSEIIVAVFDEGVTSNHPDLPNSRQIRLNGSNFGSGNPNDPSPTGNGNHGNACAGVIAATMDNNEGIAGIAPLCKIMPLRWDASSSPNDMANGILFAVSHGAKIISCSWGFHNSGSLPNLYPVIKNAIDTAIHHNVVVLFSAGNTADHPFLDDGYVPFPANADVPNLLTIGASDRYDKMAAYSPKSELIDFVAPSHRAYSNQINGETFEMWSIDIPDSAGRNPVNALLDYNAIPIGTTTPNTGTNYLSYTGYFGGTSHSCPVVAGVVALMLSVNPQLKPVEVYNILKSTSAKVGNYTYTNGRCDEMGYGRVDAFEAVWAALNTHIQGPDTLCDTENYQLLNCPPTATVRWSYTTNIQQQSSPVITFSDTTTATTTVTRGSFLWQLYSGMVTLQATVTFSGVTKVFTKNILLHEDVNPTLPQFQLFRIGLNETRTFTINNCSGIPSNKLKWRIHKPLETDTITHHGFYWSITASEPDVNSGVMNIRLYNLQNCDTSAYSNYNIRIDYHQIIDPFDPLLLFPNPVTTNTVEIQVVDQSYANRGSNETAEERPAIDYTLELWDENYGLLKTVNSSISGEKDIVTLDLSNLRNGVYFLVLKVDNQVVKTDKLIISR